MRFHFSKPGRSAVTLAGALCITALALALSTAAALDRAASPADKIMMVSLYAIFCLLSHLILCLTKRKLSLRLHVLVLTLWLFSVVLTCSNHLSFLIKSDLRAGNERARMSVPVETNMNEIEVVKVAVSKMTDRSVSIVATEIATAQDRKKRHALLLELDEARRRVRLEETLLNLTHNSQTIRFSESEDPFVHKIALLLSSSDSNVSIIFNLCIALFLELAGVILWLEYSHDKEEEPETGGEILCSGDITTSQNKPTVEQIRLFLRCGQEKAMEVHRLTAGLRRKNGNRVIG